MQVQLDESQNSCSTESLRDDSYLFSFSLSRSTQFYTAQTQPAPPLLSLHPSLSLIHTQTQSAVRTLARVGSLHFPGSSSQYRRSRTWTLNLRCPPHFCSFWKFNDVLHYLTCPSTSLLGCTLLLTSVSLALRWDKNGYLLWDSPAVYLIFHYHCLSSPV